MYSQDACSEEDWTSNGSRFLNLECVCWLDKGEEEVFEKWVSEMYSQYSC